MGLIILICSLLAALCRHSSPGLCTFRDNFFNFRGDFSIILKQPQSRLVTIVITKDEVTQCF